MAIFCIKEEIVYAILILILIFFIKNKSFKQNIRSPPIIINKIITSNKNKKIVDPILERDKSVLSNPLVAPLRRMPRHNYPKKNILLNIPTRGMVDNFQYMGNLIRRADEKIVQLFGRQTYPNSPKYEYYGMMSDHGGHQIKVQISNTKELYNGDIVNIPLLNNGSFLVQLHKLDEPRYNPNI
jgi:hypothetical protein